MRTATIYSRVSSDEQKKGFSPELQKELCSKWAKSNGYQIVGVYEDGGKSGTKTVGRDGLDDMIIQCQNEKVNVALVVDTDRIARNEVDHFNIKTALKKGDTQLIAINQPMINDSPEGQFFETILAGTNAFYSRLLGRKVKKSLEKKCQLGDFPGWAPLGYINVNKGSEEKPHKVVEIDPEKGHFITELFRLYSTGSYPVDTLVDMVYEMGLRSKNNKRVYRTVLYATLKNPFYIGMFKYNGSVLKGNHQPLTTPEIFYACQRVSNLHNQNACRRRKYSWLLNGFAYCQEDNARLCGDWSRKKNKAYYHGSALKGCHHYIPLGDIESQVVEQLGNIRFSDDFTKVIIDKAKALVNRSREARESEIRGVQNEIKALEAKRSILEDRLLDQTIDKETFKRKHNELTIDIQNRESELATIENQGGFDVDATIAILDLVNNIKETFTNAKFEAKRHYLSIFFERIEVRDKKIAKVIYTPLFQSLIEAKTVRIRPILLRVPSFALTTALSRVLKAFQNPIWAEQARERLKQIKMLTKVASV
ncbi:recombinase family protein [Patescibacteria group bacterium]|nr:recombinase family protein [Patescibacteria group bacterium]